MTLHEFIFFIKGKDGYFWQRDSIGDLILLPAAKPIEFSPDGWTGTNIRNVRNKRYFVIDRTASLPFKYVEDGAETLKHIFLVKGTEEPVSLVICELQLDYDPPPSATIAVSSGANPFTAGTNTGNIIGVPGETVFLKIPLTGTIADSIFGNIGGGILVNQSAPSSQMYSVVIPPAGFVPYNLVFTNGSGTATCSIIVTSANGTSAGSYGFWYKQVFQSEIDLTEIDHDGAYVSAPTVEEGIGKHLKANEATVYKIPLNTPDAIKNKDDGVLLNMKQNWGLAGDFVIDNNSFINEVAVPFFMKQADGLAPYVTFDSQTFESAVRAPDTSLPFNYVAFGVNHFANVDPALPGSVTLNITGKIPYQITTLRTVRNFRLTFWQVSINATATGGYVRTFLLNTVINDTAVHFYDINQTIVAQRGDRFFYTWDRNPGSSGAALSDYQFVSTGGFLKVEFETRFEPTFCRCHRPWYVFDYLIRQMSNNEYSAAPCPYFDTYKTVVFTSGDGIRGFVDDALPLSFTDYFSFWDGFDAVGIKELAGKKILFGRKKDLIDFINIKDLGIISKPKMSFDKEFPFNEINIGYENVQNEQGMVNGRNEFNTTLKLSLGTTKKPRLLDKVSKVSASCYEQEDIRIKTVQKDTTDNRGDNKPFVRHITDILIGDYYELDRTMNAFLIGVDQKDSVYNYFLSPMQNLLRSGDFLRSMLYLADNRVLKFISLDRNDKTQYINGATIIREKDNVLVGSLADRFFVPVILAVDTPGVEDPLDVLQFSFNGDIYKGISFENSINPKTLALQTYQVWATADTNLLPLIKYNGQ